MAKVITVANQKGGVGKTTTTQALAAGLQKKGNRVLAMDMDPQGNLSDSIGANNYELPTIYDVLKRQVPAEEAVQKLDSFDIIPANIMLASAEQELTEIGKEHRLEETMAQIKDKYDYIIIDTPPSLGILTVNAFTFSDEIIIPSTPGIFAANGIQQLSITVDNVKRYCNPQVKIVGILLTRYNSRINISKQIKDLTEQLGKHISAPIYNAHIRNGIVVEEAQANHKDIFSYAKKSTVSEDYYSFVEEFLKEEKKYA